MKFFTTLKYECLLKVMIPALIRLHSLQLIEKEMTLPRAKLVLYSNNKDSGIARAFAHLQAERERMCNDVCVQNNCN